MTNSHADPAFSSRERLSALVDGELAARSEVAAACAVWKDDPAMRTAWHGYQLIGDVLRSEDLASEPARDAVFLQTLRERLAAEPVVLAPAEPETPSRDAPSAGRRRGGRWAMPAAIAAGFVAVAGTLLVTRAPAPTAAADQVLAANIRSPALSFAAPPPLVATVSTPDATAAPLVVLDPVAPRDPTFVTKNKILLRDPQLDRYLAAHKQFAGSMALGMPFLRNASAEAPGR